VKLVEQEWYLIVRDPNSVVRDPKADCIRGGVRADPYVDRLTRDENLIAFDTRLVRTCRNRSGSA